MSSSENPNRPIKKAKTALSCNYQDMVKLYAGDSPEAEAFLVHKEWACNASPILAAAFNSDFLEGQTQEYRLDVPEIDDIVVKALVAWIYTSKFSLEAIVAENCDLSKSHTFKQQTICLVKLWVLADKLLMPKLQNMAIHQLERDCSSRHSFPLDMLNYIYENTSKGSPLRKFILYSAAGSPNFESKVEEKAQSGRFPPEFFFDVVLLLKSKIPRDVTVSLKAEKNMAEFELPEE